MKPILPCLALLAVLAGPAVSETTITQADADAHATFKSTDSSNTYIFTEDVTFRDYDATRPYDNNQGLIFYADKNNIGHYLDFKGDGAGTRNLAFEENNLTYSGDAPDNLTTYGSVLYGTYTTFSDFGTVRFSNNKHENILVRGEGNTNSQATYGGAFAAYRLTLNNVDHFVVDGNTATGLDMVFGGGLAINEYRTGDSGTGNLTVTNNRLVLQQVGGYAQGGGWGNNNGGSNDDLYNMGRITFTGNIVTYADVIAGTAGSGTTMEGGAMKTTNARFKNTRNIVISGNTVDASGQDYKVYAKGGGISSATAQFSNIQSDDDTPAVLISENRVLRDSSSEASYARGGGIETVLMAIGGSGDVLFENNSSTDQGGAVYLSMLSGNAYTSMLYADNGDITFKGNTDSLGASNERNSGIANAIHAGITNNKVMGLDLRAADGRNINFYDRITSSSTNKDNFVIDINNDASEGYNGTVVFSGRYAADTLAGSESSGDYANRLAASKRSDVNATINLHKGRLRIEEGAILGRRHDAANDEAGTGAVFSMTGGMLDISGSVQNGTGVLAANLIEIRGGTIMAGGHAAFEANTIDMSEGITVDLAYYFSGQAVIDTGLKLVADSFIMGGDIVLSDNNANFYRDASWASDRDFILFDISDADTVTGDFGSILSSLTSGSEVNELNLYRGEWALAVENNQVIARWSALGAPIPEPATMFLGLGGLAALFARRRNI